MKQFASAFFASRAVFSTIGNSWECRILTYFCVQGLPCQAHNDILENFPAAVLWLLMAGAVSISDASDHEWLKSLLIFNIGLCEIGSWGKMQALLRSFMWISPVHDKPGKGMFDLTVR
jgi:hypothetical protein